MATHSKIKVNLTGVHLCCQGCVDAANNALMSVDGVDSSSDMETRTATFTAVDVATAQKALDALGTAGFYGSSDNPQVAMKPVSAIPQGKVHSLEVSGIHNCCGKCYKAIKDAIESVDGVSGTTAKPKVTTFEVTGNFSAVALVKALNAAGFSARVK